MANSYLTTTVCLHHHPPPPIEGRFFILYRFCSFVSCSLKSAVAYHSPRTLPAVCPGWCYTGSDWPILGKRDGGEGQGSKREKKRWEVFEPLGVCAHSSQCFIYMTNLRKDSQNNSQNQHTSSTICKKGVLPMPEQQTGITSTPVRRGLI